MLEIITTLLLGMFLSQQAGGLPGAPIPGMSNFSVELGLNSKGRIQSLLVYKGPQLAQTLDVCTEEPVERKYPVGSLATTDYNFDGFSDLALQVASEKHNNRFCVWLFDPQGQRFEASEQLSRLTNPVPDPTAQTVVSTTYESCNYCYDKQEFRWVGKQLELFQERSLTMDPLAVGTGGCDFILTVKKRKDGELRETGRDRTNALGDPCPDDFWLDRVGFPGNFDRF